MLLEFLHNFNINNHVYLRYYPELNPSIPHITCAAVKVMSSAQTSLNCPDMLTFTLPSWPDAPSTNWTGMSDIYTHYVHLKLSELKTCQIYIKSRTNGWIITMYRLKYTIVQMYLWYQSVAPDMNRQEWATLRVCSLTYLVKLWLDTAWQNNDKSLKLAIPWEHWLLPNKLHGPMYYKIGVTCVLNGHVFYISL